MAGAPGPLRLEQILTELRDGTRILVRPVVPEDKPLLVKGLTRLSPESRFRRFMAPIHMLTTAELKYLTEIDYVDHFAWLALLRDRPDYAVGVGRYVRLADEPTVAEPAITVADELHGKGLGTLLLGLLAVAARAAGIERFRAFVLEENRPMREILGELGAETHHDSPGMLRIDVALDPDELPESPAGRVLRFIAGNLGTVRPPTVRLPPVPE